MRSHFPDITKHFKESQALPPASRSAGTNYSTGVDWTDGTDEVDVEINVGAVASGATLTITLQESKNDNTANADGDADPYANINDGEPTPTDISQSITGSNANSIVHLRVKRRSKKYIRVKAVGATDAIVFGVNLRSVRRDNVS